MRIPNMVLAGSARVIPDAVATLYHHAATTSLLGEVPIAFGEAVTVNSNSKACTSLLNDPQPAAAITNALCASFFELTTYRVLRVGLQMPFVVFVRSI